MTRILFRLTALALLSCLTFHSEACGLFAGRGFDNLKDIPVGIRDEETLIVWDESKQREDFIRKVVFDAGVDQFGLLVPVPNLPEVAEANSKVFEELRGEMEDQRPRRTQHIWWSHNDNDGSSGAIGNFAYGGAPGAATSKGVHVLSETKIGLFKARVLTASDPASLKNWLTEQGFSMGAGANEYLAHYTGGDWYWVAFSYVGDPTAPPQGGIEQITSQTFRLSFDSKEAYYPYREPRDPTVTDDNTRDANPALGTADASRTLRLYVLAADKVTGILRTADGAVTDWPDPRRTHNTVALFRAPVRKRNAVIGALVPSVMTNPVLSAFIETIDPNLFSLEASRRPNADLLLRLDSAQKELQLPEDVTIADHRWWVRLVVFVGLPFIAMLLIWSGLRERKKKKTKK